MKYIYKPKCSTTLVLKDNNLEIFMRKLKHLLYESYTRTRIDQLFNIIIGKMNLYLLNILYIYNIYVYIFRIS